MAAAVADTYSAPSGAVVRGGLPAPSLAVTGLDFPSNEETSAAETVQFRFTGANLLPPFPATYIWRINTRQQTGHYTTFFWGPGGSFTGAGYYGCHPYPTNQAETAHAWEISIDQGDHFTDDNGNTNVVEHGRWYTQAAVVEVVNTDEVRVKFYWDLPDTSKVITYTSPTSENYANGFPPTNPALTFGDAPWVPGGECLSGILRALQIYSARLTEADILTEAANHSVNTPQTAAGLASVWYMNQNPTPSDIADKSGAGHHPAWHNANRPVLYEG